MQKSIASPRYARLLAGAAVLTVGFGLASTAQAQAILAGRVYSQVAESPTTAQFLTTSGAGTINSAGQSGAGFFHGAENISTFESTPGYSTVQTFPTGLNNYSTAKAMNFSDASPDVYFSSTAGTGTSVITTGSYLTSSGNALRLQVAANTADFLLTLSFGTLTPDASNFIFTGDRGVSAVGFTLNGNYARLLDNTATVSFYSADNTLLGVQGLNSLVGENPGLASGGSDRWAFVGWRNTTGVVANDIAYLTIGFSTTDAGQAILALDDFGFSTASLASVPEPSSVAALAGFGAFGAAFGARRRRR